MYNKNLQLEIHKVLFCSLLVLAHCIRHTLNRQKLICDHIFYSALSLYAFRFPICFSAKAIMFVRVNISYSIWIRIATAIYAIIVCK
jgi:multidrug transporter EmrE-like cation transporter